MKKYVMSNGKRLKIYYNIHYIILLDNLNINITSERAFLECLFAQSSQDFNTSKCDFRNSAHNSISLSR